MPRNLPRDVTLLSRRDFGYGSVLRLTSEGPKYWHGQSISLDPDEGRERVNDWRAQYEKDRYLLLEGKHFALVEKLRQADRDFQEARRQRERDREHARWEFVDQWDKEHPYPDYPKLDDLVQVYLLTCASAL